VPKFVRKKRGWKGRRRDRLSFGRHYWSPGATRKLSLRGLSRTRKGRRKKKRVDGVFCTAMDGPEGKEKRQNGSRWPGGSRGVRDRNHKTKRKKTGGKLVECGNTAKNVDSKKGKNRAVLPSNHVFKGWGVWKKEKGRDIGRKLPVTRCN